MADGTRWLVEWANVVERNRPSTARGLYELERVRYSTGVTGVEIVREIGVAADGSVEWRYDRDTDDYPQFSGRLEDPEDEIERGVMKLVAQSEFERLWAAPLVERPGPLTRLVRWARSSRDIRER